MSMQKQSLDHFCDFFFLKMARMQFEAKMKVERGKKYIKKILLSLKSKKKKNINRVFLKLFGKKIYSPT